MAKASAALLLLLLMMVRRRSRLRLARICASVIHVFLRLLALVCIHYDDDAAFHGKSK